MCDSLYCDIYFVVVVVAAPVCIPTNSALGSLFSTSSPTFVCCFVDDGHSHLCEVVSHCGFNFHLSDGW